MVSAAVLAGDFDAFREMFDLPYLLDTDTQRFLSTTEADLLPLFLEVHLMLKQRGVTHYERVAREADYTGRHRIEGWHFTHQIARGVRVAPPHSCRETLVQTAGRWRFAMSHYPTLAGLWTSLPSNTHPEARA